MNMTRALRSALIALLAALALTGSAQAAGGNYVFEGGNAKARAQVTAALEASSFDWNVVPVQVTIHIGAGNTPHAEPGDIWLDPKLLSAGRFSWGIVQHEYAHQVAFFLFGTDQRTKITRALGAKDWCYEVSGLHHDDHACERFAATLAYAYWKSPQNTERHESKMAPAKFKALMASLGVPAGR